MKKLFFSNILIIALLVISCEKKSREAEKNSEETSVKQQVDEDTLDEFEYEADSVETDDDEDL